MEHWGVVADEACALDQLKQNATKDEILFFGRTVFQDTFRKMYVLSSYVEALTPIPKDGGHSSALHI
nr:glycosyl transferase, family 1 [Tanacetum cinerariifolium]